MARSYESLWLWLGGGFIAVGAALLGVAGGFDAASKVPYSYWTSVPVIVAHVMFGLSLAWNTPSLVETRFSPDSLVWVTVVFHGTVA